ncbi:MAG: hypothetical protein KatS3mg105_5040 [Gemmatales bacterium]|nr:MAG: hypothetical protein KatS3mg105_5040 [Gemmatales bacterium]
MRESDLIAVCLKWLRYHRIFAWRQNNISVFDRRSRSFRSFQGLRGVSDILGVLPDGRFLAIECKLDKRPLSYDQKRFLDQVKSNGGLALVARSLGDLKSNLCNYVFVQEEDHNDNSNKE